MRAIIQQLLAAQYPGAELVGAASVLTRAASTITVIPIFLLGTWLCTSTGWRRSARS